MGASLAGGVGWTLTSGAISNYVLEEIPQGERPAHLAWYNLAINAAILLGSLGGPVLAKWLALPVALFVCAVLRLLAALGIWHCR